MWENQKHTLINVSKSFVVRVSKLGCSFFSGGQVITGCGSGGLRATGGGILVDILSFLWFSAGWVDFFEPGI